MKDKSSHGRGASRPIPETPLERLLRTATTDVAARPEFYRCLLDSDILVPVLTGRRANDSIPAGETLAIACLLREDGVPVVPFFTSSATAFRASSNGGQCAVMRTRDLFAAKREMQFHLNPYSDYGREFLPHEVDCLLRTGTLGFTAYERIPEKEHIALARPSNSQSRMTAALSSLYARNVNVKAAYLAEVTPRKQENVPWLLIALDVVSDIERIVEETATVVQDTLNGGCTVDVMQLLPDSTDAVKAFCASVQPFYRIAQGIRLATAPPIGNA
jgi:hypothetical protein